MHPTSPTILKAWPLASMREKRHPASAERSSLAGQAVNMAQAMLLAGYAQVHLAGRKYLDDLSMLKTETKCSLRVISNYRLV
jgi:hypothetical protein